MSSLLRSHEFNTRWWGAPVGIVTDPAFLQANTDANLAALDQFGWVEFRAALDEPGIDHRRLGALGFFQADTQINYRLRLDRTPRPKSLGGLRVEFADQRPFTVGQDEIADFRHERYHKLPGASIAKINERYVTWSNAHIGQAPACCLRVLNEGRIEGWYLAEDVPGKGLHLTLAMLSRDARISGMLLFLKAYEAFAGRGHTLGWAAFSIENTPVHNLYAGIGARFTRPTGCWLRVRGGIPD